MHLKSRTLLVALALGAAAACAQAQVVVVGAKSPVGNLSKEQAADIFMGKMPSLPGGGAPELIDQPESAAVRNEFYTKVVGKSAAQARQYWARLAFTGKGTPPKEAASADDVKHKVNANPNAIGYIEKSAVDASVKAVFTLQ